MLHKQKEVIYLCTSVGNLDGTIDLSDHARTFEDEDLALEYAKEQTDEYGDRTYIYECKPIIKVDKGKIRIARL